jgi:hypothetical protein
MWKIPLYWATGHTGMIISETEISSLGGVLIYSDYLARQRCYIVNTEDFAIGNWWTHVHTCISLKKREENCRVYFIM